MGRPIKKNIMLANGPFVLYLSIKAAETVILNSDIVEIWYVSAQKLAINDVVSICPKNVILRQFDNKFISQLTLLYLARSNIKMLWSPEYKIRIYIANICSLVGNYLAFYKFSRDFCGKISFGLISEGIANFYEPKQIDILSKKNILFKKILAYLLGFRYRLIDGPITGVGHIDYKEMISVKGYPSYDIKTVLINVINKSNNKVNLLVLDGSAVDFLDISNVRLDFLNAANKMHLLENAFYKKHPSQITRNILDTDFEKIYGHELNINLINIQTDLPAEFLIESHNIHTVVSFVSSALLNIKLLFPDVRCICIGGSQFKHKAGWSSLQKIFVNYDIEIW